MIETSTGPPQSLRRHSEPLKAQTGSALNAPIAVLQRLICAGNVEASAIKITGTKGSGYGEPVEAIH